jgi:hypothetical protein
MRTRACVSRYLFYPTISLVRLVFFFHVRCLSIFNAFVVRFDSEQLEQWEREKHRISTQSAFIFSAFDSELEFQEYCRLAGAGNVLMAVREKLILVVNESGNQAIINVRARR